MFIETTPPTQHVLYADDDEDDRTFFREALGELKVPTVLHTVTDGIQLMKVLSPDVNPLPNVIFLDLNMPGKSGKECLREIRSMSHLHETPVIIFSTSSNHRDIEETFQHGATLYIQKPSGFKLMVDVLERFFGSDWKEIIQQSDRKKFLFL